MAKRVFVDTNPFIYCVEGIEPYCTLTRRFLTQCVQENTMLYTSTVTDAEFLVKPYSKGDMLVVMRYKELLANMAFIKCVINEAIADGSARLRAKYPAIKVADAMQISNGIYCDCDCFLTNDKHLKQVQEINISSLYDI